MRRTRRSPGLAPAALAPLLAAMLALAAAACGGGDSPAAPDLAFESPGPHPVGHATLRVTDTARARDLVIEVWYPADESARAAADAGEPVASYGADMAQSDAYTMLLAAAPAGCPNPTTHAARDATPSNAGPFPLVAFSHCHNCTRFSSFTIAERLASHGFIVVAPDHAQNTLFDFLAGMSVDVSSEFLPTRAADVRFAVDRVLAGDAGLPSGLAAVVDADRVGVFGHSFGAVTTGKVLEDDARMKAGLALAAPVENPLVQGVTLANISQPLMLIVAVEDNSITELGNNFMRNNFLDAPGEAWKLEVADAGHWSFSDIVALDAQFAPGCGDGERQTDGTPFTYLAPATGRAIGAAYVTAFFAATLRAEPGAAAYLVSARPTGVTVEHHAAP